MRKCQDTCRRKEGRYKHIKKELGSNEKDQHSWDQQGLRQQEKGNGNKKEDPERTQ